MPAQRRAPHPGRSARERIAAKRSARRPRLPLRALLGAAGLLAVLLLGGLAWRFQSTVGTIQQDDPRRQAAAASAQIAGDGTLPAAGGSLDAPFNLLLVGVDKRPNPDESVRSDTLIVVRVDPQQQWAAMLSIPRDSVVTIPNFGQAKINTAFTNGYNYAADLYGPGTDPDAGGGALAAETVEQFLGLKIDYVAQVDFAGFAGLVDAIGGVVIDVERTLLDAEYPTEDYGVERIYIPAGLQVMDGATALKYARSRHSSDDFGRAKRQQQVLRALLAQVKSRGLLENAGALNSWADVLATNVRTTLPLGDPQAIARMAGLARELNAERIVQLSINPNDVEATLSGSDLYWNQADLEMLLARWQAGPQLAQPSGTAPPAAAPVLVKVVNAAGVEGLATKLTEKLRAQGFTLATPETAASVSPATQIIDHGDQPEVAQRLADALGLPPGIVQVQPAEGVSAQIVLVVGQDYQAVWLE
ncbi:MAG: LCP family protein [Roseiflexaceae bacterium]|nr:LCP family protein [Roseiflexaceae bacterium]